MVKSNVDFVVVGGEGIGRSYPSFFNETILSVCDKTDPVQIEGSNLHNRHTDILSLTRSLLSISTAG